MTHPTYESAHRALAARLGERALAHSQGVAETAADLAACYGLDVEAARLAGLLHDWDRELTASEVLAAADRHGRETPADAVERRSPKLLHAWTGAAAVRDAFPGIDEAIVHAVARHTVGDAAMTPLDKVVYIADMIEPGRAYPGVDDLRAAVGDEALDELFAKAYTASVEQVIRERKVLHPDTVGVWNAHVAKERA